MTRRKPRRVSCGIRAFSAAAVAGARGAPIKYMTTIEPDRAWRSTCSSTALELRKYASPETTSHCTGCSPSDWTSRTSASSWQPPGKRKRPQFETTNDHFLCDPCRIKQTTRPRVRRGASEGRSEVGAESRHPIPLKGLSRKSGWCGPTGVLGSV